jgi:hypothetical protein
MLIVTNGDSAAEKIRSAGIPGSVLPWRDVLHEGPVPCGLSPGGLRTVRARFISDVGWATFEDVLRGFAQRDAALEEFSQYPELVLWFEHDLYDQLQLIQVLDFFSRRRLASTRLSLICVDEYIGLASPDTLKTLFDQRREVTRAQLELGLQAWTAFRSPDPSDIADLLREETSPLPFLAGALVRHLEQFPSTKNGLSRSEQQALGAIAAGARNLKDAFAISQKREERMFLGDATFALYLEGLSRGCHALIVSGDGRPIVAPRVAEETRQFWEGEAVVTEAGRAFLEGRRDRVRTNGIDRWLGGVHLSGSEARWRWDASKQRLCAQKESRGQR